MVVKNLQSFVENEIPGAVCSGNLRELIQMESTLTKRPTLVLDDSSTCSLFGKSEVDLIYHNPRVITKNLKSFIENIISSGADLIVVSRGHYQKDIKMWYRKQIHQFQQKKNLFLTNSKGEIQTESLQNLKGFTQQCIKFTFAGITNIHLQVLNSTDYTHKEVAKIAIKRNCLAVIGQDSDYLIYEGIRNYVLTDSINPETLDCKFYCRPKLIDHLGLSSYYMPFFATLCGNDVVIFELLKDFHKRFKTIRNRFLAIAKIIKVLHGYPYNHIGYLVDSINNPKVDSNIIKKSLDLYLDFTVASPNNDGLIFANQRMKAFQWSTDLHKLFILKQYRSSEVTGSNDPDLTPASILMRPFRGKVYGILFYHSLATCIKEYCLEEMITLSLEKLTYKSVNCIPPTVEHPGLLSLFNESTPNISFVKWNLFLSCVSKRLKQTVFLTVPASLLVPTLALHYIDLEIPRQYRQKVFSKAFEVETFLVVALLIYADASTEKLNRVEKVEGPNFKVNYLISNFLEACKTLQYLNQTCGLVVSNAESCYCNYFDESLFYTVYDIMKEGGDSYGFFGGDIGLEALFSTLKELICLNGG